MSGAPDIAPAPDRLWRQTVRLVLPREHGSWSLALEPLALGLIAAPSRAGAGLAGAVLAAFFARRPLKAALGGDAARRRLAWGTVAGLAGLGLAGIGFAGAQAGWPRLGPLLAALPPGLAFLWLEARGEAREAAAEIAGALAFAVVPGALAALAGWGLAPAAALAAVMACRSLPTILTIRASLRRRKGQPVATRLPWTASVLAVGVALLLARLHLAPGVAVVAGWVMLLRTGLLLSGRMDRVSATRIGIAEAALGAAIVLIIAGCWRG